MKKVFILGAGGVVPSIIIALKNLNVSKIFLSNRTKSKAEDLKKIDHVIVMFACGISSLLFFDAPFKSYIIISPIIALFVAAFILRFKK